MLGMEFSGRDPTGQRVMGLLPAKGLATTVDADKRFLWEVPLSWSVSYLSICCRWLLCTAISLIRVIRLLKHDFKVYSG